MEKQSLTLGHTRTGQTGSMDKGTGKVLEQGKRNETSISQPSISSGSIDPLAQPLGGHCVCRRKRTGTSRDVCQNRLESGDIHDLSTPNIRQLKPEQQDRLQRIVPREVVKNESQCDALLQVDKAKDDPVGEPLDVILRGGAFQGFKGEVGREGPCDKVRDGCSNGVDKVEESKEKDDADSQKRLGYLRVLLKRVQHRELCELLVELVEMVADLGLRLNEHGVLLKLLRCRHLWIENDLYTRR